MILIEFCWKKSENYLLRSNTKDSDSKLNLFKLFKQLWGSAMVNTFHQVKEFFNASFILLPLAISDPSVALFELLCEWMAVMSFLAFLANSWIGVFVCHLLLRCFAKCCAVEISFSTSKLFIKNFCLLYYSSHTF